MGYRAAGLVVKTSLHDHGGSCDAVSDAKWAAFVEDVEKAIAEHLSGTYTPGTWMDHHDCLCSSCDSDERCRTDGG